MSAVLKHFNTHAYQPPNEQTAYLVGYLRQAVRSYPWSNAGRILKLLDVGIGQGDLPYYFKNTTQPLQWDIHGVDGSDMALAACRKKEFPKITLTHLDLETTPLPYDYNTFDLVVCIGTLNYLSNSCNVIKAMIDVAKPEAPLVFSLLTHQGQEPMIARAMTTHENTALKWHIPPHHALKNIFQTSPAHLVQSIPSPARLIDGHEIQSALYLVCKDP